MSGPYSNRRDRGGRGNSHPYGNRQQNSNYRTQIKFGIRGFMFTVDGTLKESAAIREVNNLFDVAHSPESKEPIPEKEEVAKSSDAADDLAAACNEVASQIAHDKPFSSHRLLRQIPTNVKNVLFFESELPAEEIYAIAERIVDRCQENVCCRFIARCIPIELTTATELSHFGADLGKLLHHHFVENWKEDHPPSYALEFKARNNDQLKQKEVLMILDDHLHGLAPLATVNLKSPDLSILVNVLHKNVLLSCVRRCYHEKRKYSTRPPTPKGETNAGDSTIEKEPTNEQTVVS